MMLVSCCASSSLVFFLMIRSLDVGTWKLPALKLSASMKFTQLLVPGGKPTVAAEKTKRLKDSSLFKWLIVLGIVV